MISVIIPVYNKKDYLKYAIQSVLEQDYLDYEIILIDDGSTDGSAAICDQYQAEYRKVKVLHQKNRGVSAARNIGIRMAEGEYILFLDADDMLQKECLKECAFFLKEREVDFIQFQMCVLNEVKKRKKEKKKYSNILSSQEAVMLFYKRREITPLICGGIYRKELFVTLSFNEKIHLGEDTLCKFKVIQNSKKIGLINAEWYLNRTIENTLSRKKIDSSDLESVIDAMQSIQHSKISRQEEKKNRNNYLFHRYYAYFNLVVLTNRSLEEHPVFLNLINEMDKLDLDWQDKMILLKKVFFSLYKKTPFVYHYLMKFLKKQKILKR